MYQEKFMLKTFPWSLYLKNFTDVNLIIGVEAPIGVETWEIIRKNEIKDATNSFFSLLYNHRARIIKPIIRQGWQTAVAAGRGQRGQRRGEKTKRIKPGKEPGISFHIGGFN